MSKRKTIRVLIEIPENWFDIDSPALYISRKIKDEARDLIKEAIVEQYLSKVEMPDIKVSEKELKLTILNRMADTVFKKKREDGGFDEF